MPSLGTLFAFLASILQARNGFLNVGPRAEIPFLEALGRDCKCLWK
jgi:hypothetical protein